MRFAGVFYSITTKISGPVKFETYMTKRKLLTIAFLLLFTNLKAQVALLDMVYGFIDAKDYEKAKEAISMAEKHEITSGDPKTFYLKSFLYKDLYLASADSVKGRYLEVAINSLKKARELDKSSFYSTQLTELENFFYSGYFNDAVRMFNEQKYGGALDYFSEFLANTSSDNPYWMDANYYSGVSYQMLDSTAQAVDKYKFLISHNYDEPLLYFDLASIYLNERKEEDTIKLIINEGLARYPENQDLQIINLNYLSQYRHYGKLEAALIGQLEKKGDDVDLMLMLATTYGKIRNAANSDEYFLKIESVYKEVLNLQPQNFEANFNIGVLYYNEAVEIINKNDYDISLKELALVLEKSTSLFQKARPYLQKIYMQKKERKLLEALQAIYYNLNMLEEFEQVSKQLNTIVE